MTDYVKLAREVVEYDLEAFTRNAEMPLGEGVTIQEIVVTLSYFQYQSIKATLEFVLAQFDS